MSTRQREFPGDRGGGGLDVGVDGDDGVLGVDDVEQVAGLEGVCALAGAGEVVRLGD